MLVLVDELLPRILARPVVGYDVWTVQQMGWASLDNGELLGRAVEAGFPALVTADRNLEYQQNLARSGLGVVVLVARTDRVEHIAPLAPRTVDALAHSNRARWRMCRRPSRSNELTPPSVAAGDGTGIGRESAAWLPREMRTAGRTAPPFAPVRSVKRRADREPGRPSMPW